MKFTAYPEAISTHTQDEKLPDQWQVYPTAGRSPSGSPPGGGRLVVAQGETETDLNLRLLSLIRAKHARTDKFPRNVNRQIVLGIEEARMRRLTVSTHNRQYHRTATYAYPDGRGLPVQHKGFGDPYNGPQAFRTADTDTHHLSAVAVHTRNMAASGDYRALAGFWCANYMDQLAHSIMTDVIAQVGTEQPEHAMALCSLSSICDKAMELLESGDRDRQHRWPPRKLEARHRAPLFRDTVRAARYLDKALDPDSLAERCDYTDVNAEPSGEKPHGNREGLSQWGKATLTHAPLTKANRFARSGRGYRASEEGALFRYPHRWTIDRAVWSSPARKVGGAVLIDCSGSMSLSHEQLETILEKCPAAVVAAYAGSHDEGNIHVIAQGGRRAENDDIRCQHYDQGNVIDGPALKWLSRQTGPRVWISDGCVVGAGHSQAADLYMECNMLAQMSKIARVETVEEAAAILTGKAPHVLNICNP